MIARRLLLLIAAVLAISAASLWRVHRSSVDRTLATLDGPELKEALTSAQEIARDDFELRRAQGLPVDDVRRRSEHLDRGLLALTEADVLRDELVVELGIYGLLPALVGAAVLGIVAIAFTRRWLRPLGEATAAAAGWSRGDESAFPLGPAGTDDVRQLRAALDDLIATVRRQRLELAAESRAGAFAELALQVSHELKNLLTPVRLAAEAIADKAVDPATGQAAGTLVASLSPLQRLNGTLAALSRRPAAKVEVVDPAALLERCAKLHGVRNVAIVVAASAAPAAWADPAGLEEALGNLVVNAAEAGARRVTLSAEARGDGVALGCSDDGEGIPPENLALVRRLHFTTRPGGSGFGLPFAERVARAAGGELIISSAPGEGTRVELLVPRADDPAGR